MGGLIKLQKLRLIGNRVQSLKGVSGLQRLSELDLKCNYLSKIADVRTLAANTELRFLTLQGNPVAKQSTYRKSTLIFLPSLTFLDNQAIDPSAHRAKAGSRQPIPPRHVVNSPPPYSPDAWPAPPSQTFSSRFGDPRDCKEWHPHSSMRTPTHFVASTPPHSRHAAAPVRFAATPDGSRESSYCHRAHTAPRSTRGSAPVPQHDQRTPRFMGTRDEAVGSRGQGENYGTTYSSGALYSAIGAVPLGLALDGVRVNETRASTALHELIGARQVRTVVTKEAELHWGKTTPRRPIQPQLRRTPSSDADAFNRLLSPTVASLAARTDPRRRETRPAESGRLQYTTDHRGNVRSFSSLADSRDM